MNAQATLSEHPTAIEPTPVQEHTPSSNPSANTVPANEARSKRRQHHFANRTRCRLLAPAANPWFCPRHADLPQNQQPADLTSERFGEPAKLGDLDDIYAFLTSLLHLLSENRVSTRRAAVLAYITNQLLRTLAAIHREEAAAGPTQVLFDAPRPIRDGANANAQKITAQHKSSREHENSARSTCSDVQVGNCARQTFSPLRRLAAHE